MIENTGKNEEKFFDYDKKLYDAIHSKLKKKNYTYKELCDLLEQSPVTGNQKKRHIKELERYMDLEYNKNTKKYKIKEKRAAPLPPYPTEPSNTIYAKHVKTLLLNYLLRHQEESPGVIYISSEKLYRALGMVNSKYINFKKDNKKKLKDELIAELVINKDYPMESLKEETIKYYIDDFYSRSGSKMSTLLRNALDTLQNQNYLTHYRAYRIYWNNDYPTYSTDFEIEFLMEIEREVMDEFGFKNEKDIWYGGKTHQYWDRVLELTQDVYPEVRGVYRCHKIIGSKKNIQKALTREEETKEMHELNKKILDFVNNQAEKNLSKSENWDYTKRLSNRYLDAQYYLSDRLIKIKDNKRLLSSKVNKVPEYLEEHEEVSFTGQNFEDILTQEEQELFNI